MATTLGDVRFIVERDIENVLDVKSVVDWANMAQNDFMLRIFVPDSTTLPIDNFTLIYTVPADIRVIRQIRRQSDVDNGINRPYNPVYKLYNGSFEVPYAFHTTDTLLIDYYRYLTFFTDTDDLIDLEDRYFPLYSSFIEMKYYRLSSTVKMIGLEAANLRYQESLAIYNSTKKQVTDAYNIDIGIQKPAESGW